MAGEQDGKTAPAPARSGSASHRHTEVLDALGTLICSGALPPSSVLNTEELEMEYSASRTLIREVLRVLASLGLIESRRKAGTIVLPAESWDCFSPQVIRWKIASSERLTQLKELTELRNAVEPQAAFLAAERCGDAERQRLVELSAAMWAAGKTGRTPEFIALDVQFHAAVLSGSGNHMFGRLHQITQEVLEGRIHYGLMPQLPDHAALEWHMEVAASIQRGDGRGAREAMERILAQSLEEMSHMWEAPGAPAADRPSKDGPAVRYPHARTPGEDHRGDGRQARDRPGG